MQVPDPSRRVRLIRGAGWFIILLSAGAALLPLVERGHGATIMGVMLFLAGAAEIAGFATRAVFDRVVGQGVGRSTQRWLDLGPRGIEPLPGHDDLGRRGATFGFVVGIGGNGRNRLRDGQRTNEDERKHGDP